MTTTDKRDLVTRVPWSQLLNEGKCDQLECVGYTTVMWRTIMYYIGCLCTAGILWLLCGYYNRLWQIQITCTTCSLAKAQFVVIRDPYDQKFLSEVLIESWEHEIIRPEYIYAEKREYDDRQPLNGSGKVSNVYRYFDHHNVRYAWRADAGEFERLCGLECGSRCVDLVEKYHGLRDEERHALLNLYGENFIRIEVKPYISLFFEEVINPFYIFQMLSMILWIVEQYFIYSGCLFVMSVLSIWMSMYEIRQQSESLRDMVQSTVTSVEIVNHDGTTREVGSTSLVPGDVIVLPRGGCSLNCDCLLLNGSVIVNESMLTGESMPVAKLPIQHDLTEEFDADQLKFKVHTLYSGTTILQAKSVVENEQVLVLVLRTGFSTAKGGLVRAILYPKPLGTKLYDDAFKFVAFLAAIAFAGMCYSLGTLIAWEAPKSKVIILSLDVISIAVPPALPAAMTVGMVYAVERLKQAKIYCVSPNRINLAGKLKLVCFDKTGTMTESDLDMYAAVHCDAESKRVSFNKRREQFVAMEDPMLFVMAGCHSLTFINDQLCGDPMELKMFNALGWYLGEPPTMPNQDGVGLEMAFSTIIQDNHEMPTAEVGIVRPFPFIAQLQCMSSIVVVRKSRNTSNVGKLLALTKGAPEKIASISKPETVPENFQQLLNSFTMQGLRVIACSWKPLETSLTYSQVQKLPREGIEKDMTFLGFILLRNTLKPETKPTLEILNNADIRTVMITGDNLLTAINIAQSSAMIPNKADRVVIVEGKMEPIGETGEIHASLIFEPFAEDKAGSSTIIHLDDEEDAVELDRDRDALEQTDHDKVNFTQYDELSGKRPSHGDAYVDGVSVEHREHAPRTHLALTGQAYNIMKEYFPELIPRMCVTGTVFARMSPENKADLVEDFQNLDYCVAMCGDGANDSGALRRAHVGISLSEAEASVAAPFTSQITNISCVPIVIREGRCSLVTSISVFKYMAGYSMVQYMSVLILYTLQGRSFPDMDFLYEDLFITTVLVMLMGYTKPAKVLVARRPPSSLVSPQILFSLVFSLVTQVVFQVASYFYLVDQSWFVPSAVDANAEFSGSPQSTVLFYTAAYQLLILAISYSHGLPYRQPVYSNLPFIIVVACETILTTLVIMLAQAPLDAFFRVTSFRSHEFFKLGLIGIVALDFVITFFVEMAVVDSELFKKCVSVCRRKRKPKNAFKRTELEIKMQCVGSGSGKPEDGAVVQFDSVESRKRLNVRDYLEARNVEWPPIGYVVYSDKILDRSLTSGTSSS